MCGIMTRISGHIRAGGASLQAIRSGAFVGGVSKGWHSTKSSSRGPLSRSDCLRLEYCVLRRYYCKVNVAFVSLPFEIFFVRSSTFIYLSIPRYLGVDLGICRRVPFSRTFIVCPMPKLSAKKVDSPEYQVPRYLYSEIIKIYSPNI